MINIHLQRTLDYEDHPDWDSSCLHGDKMFAQMFYKVVPIDSISIEPTETFYRPQEGSWPKWRKWLASVKWPNPGRFEKMLDILEKDKDYWIYISW